MKQASQSHAQLPGTDSARLGARRRADSQLLGQELTLQETLRVMDVAREMRDQRQTAEEMFQRQDLRLKLRDKLIRTARLSGDQVTEEEIEAAIAQYFESLHVYNEPEGGMQNFLAHCWIWRGRIIAGAAAVATLVGSYWFLFS